MVDPALVRLPTYTTALIGRNADVAAVSALVQDQQRPLVTLVGPSGAGKTRLALEIAAASAAAFADGVVFVALAPVQDATFVIPTIARELGVQEHGHTPLLDTLGTALQAKHMLLLLDNVEQVQAAGPQLGQLLVAAPHLTLLLTSQCALDVPAETVYAIPPLSVPSDAAALPPNLVLAYPAIALFVDRMQTVQPQFVLTRGNVTDVTQICQLLNGFPLAIELVAAHSANLQPRDLLLLLRNHLGVASFNPMPLGTSREAVLRPVLDWCTSRLSPLAQRLFGGLGVFLGGVTVDGMQAVVLADAEVAAVQTALATLVQKHLVQEETLPGSEPRYVLLDAVRDYSAVQAQRQRQWAALQAQHARYYGALGAAAETALRGAEQGAWLRRLDAEIHNLRAVLHWGLTQPQANATLTLASALNQFWKDRGYYTEGRHWLAAALAKERTTDIELEAKAWRVLGALMVFQGDYAAAEPALQRSLASYRQANDQIGQAHVCNNLARLMNQQGQGQTAREYLEQSVALQQTLPEPDLWTLSVTLNNLGVISIEQGEYAAATQYLSESLDMNRAITNPTGVLTALVNLGYLATCRGDYNAAQQLFSESLVLCRDLGLQYQYALCLTNLGAVAQEQGRLAEAHSLYTEALTTYRTAEETSGVGGMLSRLGYLALLEQQWTLAHDLLAEAQQILEQIGERNEIVWVYLAQGRLALQHDDYPAAEAAVRQALAGARSLQSPYLLIDGLEALAGVRTAQEQWTAAAALLGSTEAARERWNLPRPPSAQPWFDRAYARLQRHAPTAAITTAWQQGRAQALLDSVDAVLAD